jgi:hypothetical protein
MPELPEVEAYLSYVEGSSMQQSIQGFTCEDPHKQLLCSFCALCLDAVK